MIYEKLIKIDSAQHGSVIPRKYCENIKKKKQYEKGEHERKYVSIVSRRLNYCVLNSIPVFLAMILFKKKKAISNKY